MSRIRFAAVTFDVDGTLYDFRQLIKVFGVQRVLRRRFFNAYMSAREEVRAQGEVGDIRRAQCEGIASRLACSPEEASAMTQRFIESGWDKFHRVDPIRGVRRLLESLVDHGVMLGLISDYPAMKKLEGLGLADLPWKVEVAAQQLGALKPHRLAYDHALKQLGVSPEQVLHIGDRKDADVGGAKAVGMSAAWFSGGNAMKWPSIGHEADFEFDDYADLHAWLELA